MAIANQERVGKAMALLRTGLAPFVERRKSLTPPSRSVSDLEHPTPVGPG